MKKNIINLLKNLTIVGTFLRKVTEISKNCNHISKKQEKRLTIALLNLCKKAV